MHAVIVEVRAGEGGQDAKLLVTELLRGFLEEIQ